MPVEYLLLLFGIIERCHTFREGVLYWRADETFRRQRSILEECMNSFRYAQGSVGGAVLLNYLTQPYVRRVANASRLLTPACSWRINRAESPRSSLTLLALVTGVIGSVYPRRQYSVYPVRQTNPPLS